MSHKIMRLGQHGDGVAAGPIYAARTLPGEEVGGILVGERIAKPKILAPSPHRVKASCAHYNACGGCALQHADDDFVGDWKVDVVRDALAAQGLEAQIAGLETSPPGARRRAVLSGTRTKKGAIVGFHARASDTLTPIPDCRLLSPGLMAVLPILEEMVIQGGSRRGALRFTLTDSDAGVDVLVAGGKEVDRGLFTVLAGLAERADLARLSWNSDTIVTRRPPFLQMGAARVIPPPGAFLQATAHGQAALVKRVTAAAQGARRIVDLFAGCGTFSLPLAAQAEVHAVEGVGAMLAALDQGWRGATGLRRVTTQTRDLFRNPLDAADLAGFDLAVLDPPRAGAQAQCTQIAGADLGRVVMVSCNPTSFARDARILTDAGFVMGPLTVVDQFRWSTHVELVCDFKRPGPA